MKIQDFIQCFPAQTLVLRYTETFWYARATSPEGWDWEQEAQGNTPEEAIQQLVNSVLKRAEKRVELLIQRCAEAQEELTKLRRASGT